MTNKIFKVRGIVCYNCGKEIPVGKPAIAVTAGTITEDGFVMDDDPWMTIACETCGSQINDVIAELNTAFASLG